MPISRFIPIALCLALAGCGSFGAIGLSSPFGHSRQTAANPEPIAPAPTSPVETGGLPPVSSTPQSGTAMGSNDTYTSPTAGTQPMASAPASTTTTPGTTATASAGGATSGGSSGGLSRTDLLGGWTIASGGENCQLFMTLTSWTGGYRASTRGCNNDVLKSISAWNLNGGQVVLAGNGGAPVAHLASSGSGRFDGQTNAGAGVSFYR